MLNKFNKIRKAQSGIVFPIFSESDTGFLHGQEQLRINEQRRRAEEQFQNFLKSNNGFQKMVDRYFSVPGDPPFESDRIPIYSEPNNTPEWIKNIYYYFNPSKKPSQYKKF